MNLSGQKSKGEKEVRLPSERLSAMSNLRDDEFRAALRAKLHSSLASSGHSLEEIADVLLEPADRLQAIFSGKQELPVCLLARYAQAVGRPVWWFFGDQPSTISIEGAETALGNLARMRLYLDAIESEFKGVLGGDRAVVTASAGKAQWERSSGGPVVVDFAPYLSRARAILEREADFTEDSEEVFEESVEMIAHSLYSIEMATSRTDSRETSAPAFKES